MSSDIEITEYCSISRIFATHRSPLELSFQPLIYPQLRPRFVAEVDAVGLEPLGERFAVAAIVDGIGVDAGSPLIIALRFIGPVGEVLPGDGRPAVITSAVVCRPAGRVVCCHGS